MRLFLITACALALTGCNSMGGVLSGAGSAATAANGALNTFLTDPNCAHHDEANFVTGAAGVPASFQAHVLRDCPARPASAPVAAVEAPAASPAAPAAKPAP